MKYINNKKLFSLTFLALFSYLNAQDCVIEDCYPDTCDSYCQWYVTADFIYWKTHVDNLDYANDGTSGTPGVVEPGTTKDLDWRWKPGFKVGVGYLFFESDWDAYLNYTWFYTSARNSAASPTGDLHENFESPIIGPNPYIFADSDWNLHYHTLDIEIGNWFYVNSFFSFRPNFGLRAAKTTDRDRINYFTTTALNFFNYREKIKGIGPRLGLNTNWSFFDHWSFFADGYVSFLWSRYNLSIFNANTFNPGLFLDSGESFNTIKTLTDLRIGVSWDTFFCDHYHLTLQLAWEERIWIKHNAYQRFVQADYTFKNNAGDLAFYGITLTACLAF